jgi:hypothetical protein
MALRKSTPIISTIPAFSSLLGRTDRDWRANAWGEYGFFSLEIDDFLHWNSPLMGSDALLRGFTSVRVPKIYRKSRLYLTFVRYSHGYPYVVRTRVRNYSSETMENGHRTVTIPPDRTTNPSPVHDARRRASEIVKQSRAARVSVPKSSTVRPSPQQSFRPFRRLRETIDDAGTYTVAEDVVVPQLAYSRTWSGVRTPNFGRLRKGQLPVNPHSVAIKEVGANYVYGRTYKKNTPWQDGHVRLYTDTYAEPAAPVHSALARNNALRKLIGKAELGIEANLAQDVAQFSQTTRLIASNAKRIAMSVIQLKRGNISGAVESLTRGQRPNYVTPRGRPSKSKRIADNWLELQYGWKPLLQDIHGSLKSLSVLNEDDLVQRVAASGKARSDTKSLQDAHDVPGQTAKVVTVTRSETVCRFVLRYRLAFPLRSFLAQTGFTNPINLVWEILPFSFVVDWFIPIGPYLEAFSAFDGLEFVDGSQTQFTRSWVDSAVDNFQDSTLNPTVFVAEEHCRYHAEHVILNRDKLSAFPTQTFPSFKNGFASVTHAANAIALVKSVFGR